MTTYEAMVRLSNTYIRTQVIADSAYNANLLLQSQYGADAVVSYPQPIN